MAATLTFEIGRRPGIVRRQPFARKPRFGMTGVQRRALGELVHGAGGGPRKESENDWRRTRHGADFVWIAVFALFLVLSGRALFEGVRFVHTADALHATRSSEPHVDVTITRLPPSGEALRAAAPAHSSPAVSRTM